MKAFEAEKILKEWCQRLTGAPPSTCKLVKTPNAEGLDLDWWRGDKPIHDKDTRRNTAYLAAYLEISGARIPMIGIKVWDRFLYPDRAIMRSLYEGGYLRHEGRDFVVTDDGIAHVAEWLSYDGNTFRRVTGTEQKG